jgi:hypothetical protein
MKLLILGLLVSAVILPTVDKCSINAPRGAITLNLAR